VTDASGSGAAARVGACGGPPAASWTFDAELWWWDQTPGSWVFLTIPADVADELALIPRPPKAFGSIRVSVRIGGTRWDTSVFPGRHGYVLPVKRAVRGAERIDAGDAVSVTIRTL
jgi:hypothetical protein